MKDGVEKIKNGGLLAVVEELLMTDIHITDRDIAQDELNLIYEDFKTIDRGNGIPDSPQVRYQFIAEQNGNIIGFASGLTNHKWFFLSDMWVESSHRRQGLGSKLLTMLEERVRGIGIEHIYTWTSGEINERFYERHGYREFTVFENFFEVDGFNHIGYRKDFTQADEFVAAPFWSALDKLVSESNIIIDRPKGSRHPKYPELIYPVDYGYLENTSSMDGGGIDVWKGTDGDYIDAIICTVDLKKRDSEIKILIGCSENEKRLVLETHNDSEYMKGILIQRDA